MPDGLLNADEMSRNMPAVLPERPGAFLPHYDVNEMISYAERERANRATCLQAMQLTDTARPWDAAWAANCLRASAELSSIGVGGRNIQDRLPVPITSWRERCTVSAGALALRSRRSSPRQVVGALAGHTADSLFIIPERAEDPTAFALIDITRLEMNLERGTRSRAGARVGFVVALVGGVAYGLAQGDAESLIAGTALSSAICVPAGAIIGRRLKIETWADISLSEVEVTDVRGPDGVTIRLSLRL